MLTRIHSLAEEKANFAFETTSRTFAPWIIKLKKQGYQFHLIFLWLNAVDLAIYRVEERIKMGGHSIPESTIRRRYHMGLKNFFNLYEPITDSWQFYDNSNIDQFGLIALKTSDHTVFVKKQTIWKQLLEIHCEE